MSAALAGALVLALVAVLAMWRIGRAQPLLLALQPLLALGLWLALWPPTAERPGDTLVVVGAHASAEEWQRHRQQGIAIALPGAPRFEGAQAMPDLATALRRWPTVTRLRVIGDGLDARDREAVGARSLAFDPAPARAGIDQVVAPTQAFTGRAWRVQGHANAPAGARLDLLDPAGFAVAGVRLSEEGNFELVAKPPAAGRVAYDLRLRDAGGRQVDRQALPVVIGTGRQPLLWLSAGGPDPEQKYLRRWAEDAGWRVRARSSLGAGVQVGDALSLQPPALAEVDLLVMDARSLRGLSPAARLQLRRAVAEGLGLLLRLHDAEPGDRALLREFGFEARAAPPALVLLAGARAPFEHEEPTRLTRAPLQAAAADAAILLRDAGGAPLAQWRALGRGRVGAWGVGEGYRLVLAGQADVYGALWSSAASILARAQAPPGPRLVERLARAQQRAVVCGLDATASVTDAESRPAPLRVDARGCAAWWPAQAGWHRVDSGGRARELPVHGESSWPAQRARLDREATLALRTRGGAAATAAQPAPRPRWPGFALWLLACALAWWRERRARGAMETPV